jgi:hypothetical protein
LDSTTLKTQNPGQTDLKLCVWLMWGWSWLCRQVRQKFPLVSMRGQAEGHTISENSHRCQPNLFKQTNTVSHCHLCNLRHRFWAVWGVLFFSCVEGLGGLTRRPQGLQSLQASRHPRLPVHQASGLSKPPNPSLFRRPKHPRPPTTQPRITLPRNCWTFRQTF